MKKIHIYILLMVLLFRSFLSDAQNFSLGVRGGISIPNLSTSGSNNNPVNSGYSSRLGPDLSVFGEYYFTKLFSIEAMVEYSSQGGMKNGMQGFTTPSAMEGMFPPGGMPQYLYADYKSEAKLNYLMVPILAKVGWNLGVKERLRLYVDAGPFAGVLVYAHNVTSGSSIIYLDAAGQQPITPTAQSFNSDNDVKSQLNTFNFGVSGNLGLSYSFGKQRFFIEGGGNYGFLNIQKDAQNGNNNTGAASATIGYSYGFGHKMKGKTKNGNEG
jgi:hypothetical protein